MMRLQLTRLIPGLLLASVNGAAYCGGYDVMMSGTVMSNAAGNRNGIIEILPDYPELGREPKSISYISDAFAIKVGEKVFVEYRATPDSDYDGELKSLEER